MDIRGKKALVIGGAGFIGSHVVEELLKHDVAEVIIYDNFTRGSEDNIATALNDPRVRVFHLGGDILHSDILEEAIKDADLVFHLAALWLLHCYDYPRSAFHVNVEGTFNVLELCVKHNVEKLIYSSSASVYGDAIKSPMKEDHPFNNNNFYGATKIACEQFCRAFHHRYGLDYVGLRYMNVYGARQDYKGAYIAVIMKILDRLQEGMPPVVHGDGKQSYDFIYVSDVAKANVCAAISDATDDFYNVGRGVKTTIKELAETILKITDSKHEIEYQPADRVFVTSRVGSTRKAEKELNFTADIDLEEGLRRVVQWRLERDGRGFE
ncbi:NAD-dependent epimerase/dehydratase family protein [Limisalsivibrio acetivorans]|uniref:NAD-dependent epimerase/dehydratase family protein n=1 Tax=Limisalsivibrio acetivorans TaxID=1304888 RepID=UPI0003B36A6D|nr:NAD-dependent epimerase/dehydratase family protein [Limisalsivibrio acetivorans]